MWLESVFPIEPILAPWVIVVVARGLISVSIVVLIALIPMIGAVFTATLETFIVGAIVLVRQPVVVPVVRAVTAVFIIMSKCGYDGCTQQKYRGCE